MSKKFSKRFYSKDALKVAKKLLGSYLFTEINGKLAGGKIVETEAYCGEDDKASHAYDGKRTKRTETMYGPPGFSYIYLVYGLHHQFNAVVSKKEDPQAVLVRGLEPIEGIDTMKKRRGFDDKIILTNGPGKLCQALGITRDHNKANLSGNNIWIEKGEKVKSKNIVKAKRIGIDYAEDHANLPYRFYIKDNDFVSKTK